MINRTQVSGMFLNRFMFLITAYKTYSKIIIFWGEHITKFKLLIKLLKTTMYLHNTIKNITNLKYTYIHVNI